MTGSETLVKDLAIVLGTAAVTTVLCRRVGLPVVLGFVLAGMLVGPHVPVPLAADPAEIRTLSELGVILLMFSIGLEFSLRKLVRVGAIAGLVTLLEVSFMLWLGYQAGQLLGWGVRASLFGGAIVAISSTMTIARTFAEQRITAPLAQLVFGVLVFEDLVAVLLLTVLTPLAAGGAVAPSTLAVTVLRLGVFLAGLMAAGLLLIPRLVRAVSRLGSGEVLLLVSVGVCFTLALLAERLGYSVALGAFLAGALVAESGVGPRVEELVGPLRDLFAAIFFVSVGMLIEPRSIVAHWPAVLVLTLVVICGKIIGVSTGVFFTGHGMRVAVQAGLSMAQIGEFSFILAGAGQALGPSGEFLYPVAVAVSAITAFLTPWLTRIAGPAAAFLDRHLPRALQTFASLYGSWLEQLRAASTSEVPRSEARRLVRSLAIDTACLAGLIIAAALAADRLREVLRGFGFSDLTARALVIVGAALLSVPFWVGLLRCARRLAVLLAARVIPRREAQADLGAAPRRALALTLHLLLLLLAAGPLLALTQPFLPLLPGAVLLLLLLAAVGVAFWYGVTNLQGHARAGAQVILEALSTHGRGAAAPPLEAPLEQIERLLPGLGALRTVRLPPDSAAAGQALAQLNIRGSTGAMVLAVQRGAGGVVAPGPDEVLQPGDVLVLMGTEEAVQAAARHLLAAPAEEPQRKR